MTSSERRRRGKRRSYRWVGVWRVVKLADSTWLYNRLVIVQEQLSQGKFALLSCEELLEFANKTLTITDEEEFLKVEIQAAFRSFPKPPL